VLSDFQGFIPYCQVLSRLTTVRISSCFLEKRKHIALLLHTFVPKRLFALHLFTFGMCVAFALTHYLSGLGKRTYIGIFTQ